jgi:DNA sulfur modification protein DndD
MFIETLTLKNFRQFRGKHTLRFSQGRKNVTVVFGENGRGKTGIFRALVFCLFGDRQLSQDGTEVDDREVHLVNTAAVQEIRQTGKPVDGGVELVFTHADHRYTLKRSLQSAIQQDGDRLEEQTELLLTIEKPDGNCQVLRDPDGIRERIRAVIDYRVREYFLFDGEKIENLTRASQHQKKEVSRGVRNLLNIDAIEMALRALRRLGKDLGKELERTATGELGRVMKRLNEATTERDTLEEQIGTLEGEIEQAEQEKEDLDKKLKKYRGIRELVEKREMLDEQIRQVELEMHDLRAELRDRLGRSALLLCSPEINAVFKHIDKRKKKGEIPPEIRCELIEKLLADGMCICGREICKGTEEHAKLQEWLRKVTDPNLGESAWDLWGQLLGIIQQEGNLRRSAETALQNFGRKNSDLEKARRQLQHVNDRIGEDVRDDAMHWEKQRKKVETDILDRSVKKKRLEERRDELASEIDQLEGQKAKLDKERGLQNELSKRHAIVQGAFSALNSVATDFTHEARQTIATEATKFLQTFLDEESRELFQAIVVNDDYSLQILDQHHNPTLANISAGQRQLMSIAFIAALAKTAAAGHLLEMPLFMDTPFGRLSLDHRLSLINNIPNLCAQWILLATDTELRRAEAIHLRNSKRWGKFYRLVANSQGETTVEEQSVDDALLILREEEETLT